MHSATQMDICINIYLPTTDENIWRAANTRNVPLPPFNATSLLFGENPTLSKTLELKRAKLLQMCETLLHFAATYSGLPEDYYFFPTEIKKLRKLVNKKVKLRVTNKMIMPQMSKPVRFVKKFTVVRP